MQSIADGPGLIFVLNTEGQWEKSHPGNQLFFTYVGEAVEKRFGIILAVLDIQRHVMQAA